MSWTLLIFRAAVRDSEIKCVDKDCAAINCAVARDDRIPQNPSLGEPKLEDVVRRQGVKLQERTGIKEFFDSLMRG